MSNGSCLVGAGLWAAMVGGARPGMAGLVGYCRSNCSPAAFSCIQVAAREPRKGSANGGLARIFRASLTSTYALLAALVPRKQIDLTPDLEGPRRRLWDVPNIICHALRSAISCVATFLRQPSQTICLRTTFV